jgi:hypothetical protein
MKKVFLFIFLFFVVSLSYAQYQPGKNTLGAVIGFGNGSLPGSDGIPLTIEYNFLNIIDKQVHFGVLGGFASTKEDFNFGSGNGYYKYTNIIIAAQANYHFLAGNKFDPFAGLAMGFNIASASWSWDSGTGSSPSASSSGIFWDIQLGCNYWFSPKWAMSLRLGYFPYFGLGVMAAL